jgi:hypothetical protein
VASEAPSPWEMGLGLGLDNFPSLLVDDENSDDGLFPNAGLWGWEDVPNVEAQPPMGDG